MTVAVVLALAVFPFVVKRSRALKAVIFSVAVFGSFPLSASELSFSGRPVSILGSVLVSP